MVSLHFIEAAPSSGQHQERRGRAGRRAWAPHGRSSVRCAGIGSGARAWGARRRALTWHRGRAPTHDPGLVRVDLVPDRAASRRTSAGRRR